MNIDSRQIISVTDANQNFSKVMKIVEENGQAIIFKRNKPKYAMLDLGNAKALKKSYKQIMELGKDQE